MRRIVILAGVLALALILGLGPTPAPAQAQARDLGNFVGFVVDHLNTYWDGEFREGAFARTPISYQNPRAVPFNQPVGSGCGGRVQPGESGSFYCRQDRTVYIDVLFLQGIWRQDADFAVAYVLAHEWAHHVQNLLGIAKSGAPRRAGELYSVEMELQADCLAGVWARATAEEGILEEGDLEEGVAIAAYVGDSPETPRTHLGAHGSGRERARWFMRGYHTGDVVACDLW
jgi:uncharacterized protein